MNKRKFRYKTSFLLPKNSFWVGLGSVLNVSGNYFDYNYSHSTIESDQRALLLDWWNVGKDFSEAKKKFEKKHSDELCLK